MLKPLREDLDRLRELSGDPAGEYVFRTRAGVHWVETDWRNYRSRHVRAALGRVEAEWHGWRRGLGDPATIRESVAGLASTRSYDLGRHTHSALMLASGMSLQRLARIQGHGIRVLDEAYSEQLAEFEERAERIDPVYRSRALSRPIYGVRANSIASGMSAAKVPALPAPFVKGNENSPLRGTEIPHPS